QWADRNGRSGIGVEKAELAVRLEAGELAVPLEQPALGLWDGLAGVRPAHDHRALGPEARERLALLDQELSGAHDCLVVTLLVALDPPELSEPVELVAAVDPLAELVVVNPLPEDVVVTLVVGCAELDAAVLVFFDASAGSWPLTSTIAIKNHVARKRTTAPE